ncbi:hypothetical protein [Pseudonocardia sp.]|uniref:hypothetical protein n=1 Tax=Pseudonocardia sp. TaxID=60912 RepID=UPI003D0CBFA0
MRDETEPEPEQRKVPLPIQREVRQRCGFGCVICGLPLYEYEHMLEWAAVKRHVADEITLLCDQHHREKTGKLLPPEKVAEANANPLNLRTGHSKPYTLHYSGTECEISIGGCTFTTKDAGYGTSTAALVIDDVPMLGFVLGDGHLLLHLNLFNEFNEQALRIANNALVYSTSPWDIRLTGRRLEIREDHGKFLVGMSFEVPNRVVIDQGRFMLNGIEVVIEPDFVAVLNNKLLLQGCSAVNVPVGICLGTQDTPRASMMRIHKLPRHSGESRAATKAWVDALIAKTSEMRRFKDPSADEAWRRSET